MRTKRCGKKVVSEQDVLLFNAFRDYMKGKEVSRTEMLNALHKELGYTKHDSLLKALTDGINPPIVRVRRGVYRVAKDPVYIQRLQTAFDVYTKCANPRHYDAQGHYDEKKRISIDDAIKVLKDAGYKVLKPVTQYEEV